MTPPKSSQAPAVSVVTPCFNPGPYLRPLLDSLDAQHPVPGGFEAIFVDDGSTDGTGLLLERWVAQRPWARVIHEAPSGWASRPRNVGMDAARGEYVFLVDADDHLTDDALARTFAFARAHDADIVVGKMQGVGRKVPVVLFRRSVADARPPAVPLQDSMTSHALFRRRFLLDNDLRFDEDARRVEDHIFMAQAYTRAHRIAVYAESTVYVHTARDDGGGIGYRGYRPEEYYPALDRAVEAVVTALPPGSERDAYLARWIRHELVGRLRSEAITSLPARERDAFFTAVQELLRKRMPETIIRSLPAVWRWPTALAWTASAREFFAAEALIGALGSDIAAQPGTRLLREVLSPTTAQEARRLLGGDPPPAVTVRADALRAAQPTRLRRAAVRVLARVAPDALRRRVVAWGRTPAVFARASGASLSALASATALAVVIAGGPRVLALVLCLAAAGVAATLAVRSPTGAPTAARFLLSLSPAAAAALSPPWAHAAAVASAVVVVASNGWADHRWRRLDIRAHGALRGGAVDRLGWIGLAAVATALAVGAVDAVVLVGEPAPLRKG